ncbi:hypothetical protein AVEN_113303-1 [Araneus ventricosus]|uniref:Uncharacterized protein n=1 Tax=Araneus ventricosus TaxID=182803 RepID=A0A4Y2GJX3_ARAVE|nr:hypothetical protein AVEN_113303-1 [Araneus ventricosus]
MQPPPGDALGRIHKPHSAWEGDRTRVPSEHRLHPDVIKGWKALAYYGYDRPAREDSIFLISCTVGILWGFSRFLRVRHNGLISSNWVLL